MGASDALGDCAQGSIGLAIIVEAVFGRGDEIGPALPFTHQPGSGAHSYPMRRGDAAGFGEGLGQSPKPPSRGVVQAAMRLFLEPVGNAPGQQVTAEPLGRRHLVKAASGIAQRR